MKQCNMINYDSLQIDKEDSTVYYNDQLHKYWVKDTEQECVSVTTLIHKFCPEFDGEFWSSYKSLEALSSADDFKPIKKVLLDSKRFNEKYIIDLNIDRNNFDKKKQEILAEWDEKNRVACERGTEIHRFHELQHLDGKTAELKYLKLGGKFKARTDNKIVEGKHIYPELLLSRISEDGQLRLAGQADLIIVDGWDVWILDYKSNRKLDLKSFFNQKTKKSTKMLYPLNNIDDCNFQHYSLQLSTYGWMIQKIDPRFNIKGLTLIHLDHDGGESFYECEYLKNDVERMLAFYKKQNANENRKNKNQPIKY